MATIICPCAECIHNDENSHCTAEKIFLKYRSMNTVNEGMVDMWVCDKYEMSEEFKKIKESIWRMFGKEV